jgi:hypothetical protein
VHSQLNEGQRLAGLRNDVCNQSRTGAVGDQLHHYVADRGVTSQRLLDLGRLDPLAADLYLPVAAT